LLYFRRFVAVHVRYVTDPACSWSWGAEPTLRRLTWEFGDALSFTYVMGGLARDYPSDPGVHAKLVVHWIEAAAATSMPLDPRLWIEGPIRSSYPACMAAVAAGDQGEAAAARYLRALREGLMCFRRKLDTTEALVEEARRAGLDVERFRIDLASNATVETFGAQLEEARRVPREARRQEGTVAARDGERLTFPSLTFTGDDGVVHGVYGMHPYERYRAAAEAAGASSPERGRPAPREALERFGRMAAAELEAVCGRPGPPLRAELWALATEWRLRPTRVLTGWLWELA
jgi:protein-disulfide isomerase-like protein with CxxC motif